MRSRVALCSVGPSAAEWAHQPPPAGDADALDPQLKKSFIILDRVYLWGAQAMELEAAAQAEAPRTIDLAAQEWRALLFFI